MAPKAAFALLVVFGMVVLSVHAAEVESARKHHRRAHARVSVSAAVQRYTTAQLLENPAVKEYFKENPLTENNGTAANVTIKGVEIIVHSLKFPNGTKDWKYKQSYKGTDLSITFTKPYVEASFQDAFKDTGKALDSFVPSTCATFDSTTKLYKFASKGTLLAMRKDKETTLKTSNKLKLLWPRGPMPDSARVKFGLNNDQVMRIMSQNVDTPTDEGVFSVWSGIAIKAADLIGDNKTVNLKMHIMVNEPPYVELTYSAKYM